MAGACRGCCAGCGPRSRTSSTRCRSGCPCPAVVTIHDLSFERDAGGDAGRRPAASSSGSSRGRPGRAARVIAVSERTKRDLVDLYGIPPDRITVTPHGVDPAFGPGDVAAGGYLLFVGAIQARKDPLAAAARGRGGRAAARRRRAGEGAGARARARARAAPTCAATSRRPSSPRSTAAPRRSSCRRATRASACRCWRRWRAARRSSPTDDPAMREVAGDAAVYSDGELADAIRARARRPRPARRRRARARGAFSWDETARRTLAVYREALGVSLRDRRLARPPRRSSPSRCPRSRRRSTRSSLIANIPGSLPATRTARA